MKKTRYFVTDIRQDLLEAYKENKNVLDTFGRYFNTEKQADSFISENPLNNKYEITTEGRKIIKINL